MSDISDALKYSVLITRDQRLLYHYLEDDDETWNVWEIENHKVLEWLNYTIALEEGLTLREFFKLMDAYPLFRYISPGLVELKRFGSLDNIPDSGCVSEDISYLGFRRVTAYEGERTIDLSKLGMDEGEEYIEPYIVNYIDFFGETGDKHYGLELAPFNEIFDHEIKIVNSSISIELPGKTEDYENLQDKFIIREAEDNDINLFEFVTEIIRELTFSLDK